MTACVYPLFHTEPVLSYISWLPISLCEYNEKILVTLLWLTSARILSRWIRGGGSCSMSIYEAMSQSFSQSAASWTGSNPALQGNWRQGRHGGRLSKGAEGCVTKGLAEAHHRRVKGELRGGSFGWHKVRETQKDTWFWNDWELNDLCWQKARVSVDLWARESLDVYPHSKELTWEASPRGCCLFSICQTVCRKYSQYILTDT